MTDRPASAEADEIEIEVTEEMVKAGVEVFDRHYGFRYAEADDIVHLIFRAMVLVAPNVEAFRSAHAQK